MRVAVPTAGDLHRAWLELVQTDGPFLSVPALKRVWPQGMPQPAPSARTTLRLAKPAFEKAWDAWDRENDDTAAAATALDGYRAARALWLDVVLREVLGWGERYVTDPSVEPFAGVAAPVHSPDLSVAVRPDGALAHDGAVRALVLVVDPVQSLHDPSSDGWAASPVDRMEELLRARDVPVGVVTDGRWWALVSAAPGTMVASGVLDALRWVEEPLGCNAFAELLHPRRLLGGKAQDRLPALFADSVAAAEEITEALGVQVRRAVELLVQALSDAGLDARRRGEPDPLPAQRHEVYEAAVTVLMRVVFLLFAEQRGLLPQSRLFALGYGISDELAALGQRARDEGDQALDATHLTWHRLLATSQALYQGATFEDLRLPSYGGSLFDGERFPFLTERTARGTLAVAVSDRVMLEVLRAVQIAHLRGQPARSISFRDIDVEQIGYIYEGLLGYSCEAAEEVVLGLIGRAGSEPEIALADLESLAARHETVPALAAAVLAHVKATQPAGVPASKAALTKALAGGGQGPDAERALRAVTSDPVLRERLLPFVAVIRRDLRDRPLVIPRGGLVLVETPSRATAGAHYTPKSLAQEVVEHALEPLVYAPGPHQTPDRDAWVPLSSNRILGLKVADIACGSGAFLVAAARYLAERVVEAERREGIAQGSPHEQFSHAIRQVVASCLYGADINAMAVEMCKLSLWLVSLDPKLPFSFVDDKVLHGNSLLGLTDVAQLKSLHIDPAAAKRQASLFDLDVDERLAQATNLRRLLASEVRDDDPQRSAVAKRRQWAEYQDLTRQLSTVADGVVATGLRFGGKPGRKLDEAYDTLRLAVGQAFPAGGVPGQSQTMDDIIEAGLTPIVRTDYGRWKPLHWVLAVPDVLLAGGFHAIIGNPPFLGGQKLTGAMGTNVRDWFVHTLAGNARGSADLVAYFLLRAETLLQPRGTVGLIATNTVAQGDTRQVGLDRLVANGFTITRAVQSRSWPAASANLEYAAVWGSLGPVAESAVREADGVPVRRISTLLEPAGRVEGPPIRLQENEDIAFQGCIVLGMGFVLEPAEAAAWIAADPRNAEVLFPYLNGEDLNSRPDCSPSRWVIDFGTHTEKEAATYALPYQRLLERVKPERARKPKAVRDAPWWRFLRSRPALHKAIRSLDEVLSIALVSKTVMPLRVPTGQVFSHALGVITLPGAADLAVLSSSLHQIWAIKFGSGMRNDPRYTPSDVFETFPRPKPTDRLAEVGKALDTDRREIMLRRGLGLTKLYNLVNDPDVASAADLDVARMREIHVELDEAVLEAYGWDDVPLGHGFHTYRQMRRWTISPAARVEVLDRLLAENHRRAEAQPAPSVAKTLRSAQAALRFGGEDDDDALPYGIAEPEVDA